MFEHFFRKYKECVFTGKKEAIKLLSWGEWATFVLALLSVVAILVAFLIHCAIVMAISGALMIIFLVLSEVAYRHRVKKDKDKLFIRFKRNELKPLIALLKSEQFDLWDSAKVAWLIQSCNDRIRDSEKPLFGETKTFTQYIYPLLTLIIGVFVKEMTLEDAITFFAVICLIIYMFSFVFGSFKTILHEMLHPERDTLLMLKSDLEYIAALLVTGNEEKLLLQGH